MFISINDYKKSGRDFYSSSLKKGKFISKRTKERDVVLISKRTSFDQIECFIGCILFNRIPIIIPHPSNKVFHNEFGAKLKKINNVVTPKLCISDEQDKNIYNKLWKTIVDVKEEVVSKNELIKIDKNKVAFIQLSSGTTGLPKVVKITHAALINQCDEYAAQLSLKNSDVIVSWLPLYHDMGLIACFLMPLLKNISFVHIHTFDWLSRPEIFFKKIEEHKGTHAWFPNFAFSYMAKKCKNNKYDLSSLKKFISCSEMTHFDDIISFFKAFKDNGLKRNILNVCYALAENVFSVSQANSLKKAMWNNKEVMSCGELTPGTTVLIKKNNKNIITDNIAGSILIKSSYMANNLKVTANGFYETGDWGFFKDNELYILGREDDMINSYGKNIFPYDIEGLIANINNIIKGRVACFGVYNNNIGTEDIYVVAEVKKECNFPELESRVSKLLYKTFQTTIYCKAVLRGYIVKTSSGKISRKRTRDKFIKDFIKLKNK